MKQGWEYGILDDNRNFSRSLYNYDNLNRNISITDYNSDESIYEFIHYEYDSSNRIIKSIHMKPDKNKLSERLYIEEKYIYEYEEIF